MANRKYSKQVREKASINVVVQAKTILMSTETKEWIFVTGEN
jgi:hypothetical protein